MKIDRDKVKPENIICHPEDERIEGLMNRKVLCGDRPTSMIYEGVLLSVYGTLNNPFEVHHSGYSEMYAFIAPIEEPKCEFTEGQRILVSDDGNIWRERTFVRYQEEANRMNFEVVMLGCEQQWHKTKSKNLVVSYLYGKPLPERKYRPFANAEEFKPHRDEWLKSKDTSEVIRFESYDDTGVDDVFSWKELFKRYTFEDGTPCGVEVE